MHKYIAMYFNRTHNIIRQIIYHSKSDKLYFYNQRHKDFQCTIFFPYWFSQVWKQDAILFLLFQIRNKKVFGYNTCPVYYFLVRYLVLYCFLASSRKICQQKDNNYESTECPDKDSLGNHSLGGALPTSGGSWVPWEGVQKYLLPLNGTVQCLTIIPFASSWPLLQRWGEPRAPPIPLSQSPCWSWEP